MQLNWLQKLFTPRAVKEELHRLEMRSESQASVLLTVTAERDALATDLQNAIIRDPEDTYPWFDVRTGDVHPVHGLKVELDWNPAFIQYMRDRGTTGTSEEAIVQKWLSALYNGLIQDMEEVVIENNSEIAGKEFE